MGREKSPVVHFLVFSHDFSQDCLSERASCMSSLLINHKKCIALMLIFISLLYNPSQLLRAFSPWWFSATHCECYGSASPYWGEDVGVHHTRFLFRFSRSPHLSVFLSARCPNQSNFKKNPLCSHVVKRRERLLRLSSGEGTFPSTLPLF